MIQGMKYLRLYRIEIVKLEKHLQLWIVQGCPEKKKIHFHEIFTGKTDKQKIDLTKFLKV